MTLITQFDADTPPALATAKSMDSLVGGGRFAGYIPAPLNPGWPNDMLQAYLQAGILGVVWSVDERGGTSDGTQAAINARSAGLPSGWPVVLDLETALIDPVSWCEAVETGGYSPYVYGAESTLARLTGDLANPAVHGCVVAAWDAPGYVANHPLNTFDLPRCVGQQYAGNTTFRGVGCDISVVDDSIFPGEAPDVLTDAQAAQLAQAAEAAQVNGALARLTDNYTQGIGQALEGVFAPKFAAVITAVNAVSGLTPTQLTALEGAVSGAVQQAIGGQVTTEVTNAVKAALKLVFQAGANAA